MKHIYHHLVEKLQSGTNIQLGILLDTKGSAPQIPGAIALFDKDEVICGTLGGGLLESYAQKAAAAAFKNKQNTLQLVNFNADIDDEIGAICGGFGLFAIDYNPKQHLPIFLKLLQSFHQQKKGALISLFKHEENKSVSIERYWIEYQQSIPETIAAILTLQQLDLNKVIDKRETCWIEKINPKTKNINSRESLFIEPIYPLSQLIIVGAGHVGQALAKMAQLADFKVTVLDHRLEFCNLSRFSEETQLICKPLSEGFKSINITSNSYIVIASQGHKTDTEALQCCIHSDAAFIGIIGSKRKSNLMRRKFLENSWATEEDWNFIHSPIGLDIHSKTVNEIAISITAQLIQERYQLNFLGKRKKVSCLVLAAGKSTRMGTQKLLLPYQNTSIIKSIVYKATHSNAHQTVVVLGSHQEEIRKELKGCFVDFIENKFYEAGMLSSIQQGTTAVDRKNDGILLLLGDQPMVSTALINRLITVFQKTEKGLLILTFNKKRGHPVLISTKYLNQIHELNPEIGLRALFQTNSDDVLEIEVSSAEILKDIDTPEDYELATIHYNI